MRYHFQIVSSFDLTHIRFASKGCLVADEVTGKQKEFEGWNTDGEADEEGEKHMRIANINTDEFYVKVVPIAGNVEEEDMLNGLVYPGHEMWDDIPQNDMEFGPGFEDDKNEVL